MTKLVYNGIFIKSGKEVFRSQMIAGYTQIITGFRPSTTNGWAIERNTRYTDHVGGNSEMLTNLFSGRPLNGWSLRKILETVDNYDDAGRISILFVVLLNYNTFVTFLFFVFQMLAYY